MAKLIAGSSAPWSKKIFLWLRWFITPYEKILKDLPEAGTVMDFGCGHGLFSLFLATERPGLQVIGVDHDAGRIRIAQSMAQRAQLPNVQFLSGPHIHLEDYTGKLSAVAVIDVLHYFPPDKQAACLQKLQSLLSENGKLLVRETGAEITGRSWFNYLYEKLSPLVGITQTEHGKSWLRSSEEWQKYFESLGFQCQSERCSAPIFNDYLFVCSARSASERPLSPGIISQSPR